MIRSDGTCSSTNRCSKPIRDDVCVCRAFASSTPLPIAKLRLRHGCDDRWPDDQGHDRGSGGIAPGRRPQGGEADAERDEQRKQREVAGVAFEPDLIVWKRLVRQQRRGQQQQADSRRQRQHEAVAPGQQQR